MTMLNWPLNSLSQQHSVSRLARMAAARWMTVPAMRLPSGSPTLVIQDLQRNHPQASADWVAHLKTILPDLTSVSVRERPEDRHLSLAVSYASTAEPVPSWLVSDGTLRLLALTLLAYLPQQEGIYLIEEHENGIHSFANHELLQGQLPLVAREDDSSEVRAVIALIAQYNAGLEQEIVPPPRL
ncbi:MAG: hypothetical protein EOM24_25605 [Chloroflexia bacterium]|nr:hypothetical protein [Chloroflexia bacterium]